MYSGKNKRIIFALEKCLAPLLVVLGVVSGDDCSGVIGVVFFRSSSLFVQHSKKLIG